MTKDLKPKNDLSGVIGEIETIAEQVYKAYCQFKKDKDGEEYWTKGDYSLLDDKWKEADRYTVRAVLKVIKKRIEDRRATKQEIEVLLWGEQTDVTKLAGLLHDKYILIKREE